LSWEEPFKEREKGQEAHYFQQRERELRASAREEQQRARDLEDLSTLTGIEDAQLLGALVAGEIRPDNAAAFDLMPMLRLAWADGPPSQHQQQAIRREAELRGIHGASPGRALLEQWLLAAPAQATTELWGRYARARCVRLDGTARELFHHALVRRARAIARKRWSVLGLGFGVSRAAAAVLAELERPFQV